jgi:hypothetical protein
MELFHNHRGYVCELEVYKFCERHHAQLLARPNFTWEINQVRLCFPRRMWEAKLYPLLSRHDAFAADTASSLAAWRPKPSPLSLELAKRGAMSSFTEHVIDDNYTDAVCYEVMILSSKIPRLRHPDSMPFIAGIYTSGLVQAVMGVGTTHGIPLEIMLIIFDMVYAEHMTVNGVMNALALCPVKTREA